MELQSGAKEKFYFTVCYTNLISNCEAQRVSKNLKNVGVRGQNNSMGDLSVFFYFFKENITFKSH